MEEISKIWQRLSSTGGTRACVWKEGTNDRSFHQARPSSGNLPDAAAAPVSIRWRGPRPKQPFANVQTRDFVNAILT